MSAILERPARERDLVRAFEVALDKARELKYQLERMKVTFSVSDDACTAYFEVVPEPGHLVLGGDLTIRSISIRSRSSTSSAVNEQSRIYHRFQSVVLKFQPTTGTDLSVSFFLSIRPHVA